MNVGSQAQVVIPCDELEATVDWFVTNGGFRLLMITPADDPRVAVIEGHGLTVRLDRSAPPGPTSLRIPLQDDGEPTSITGPNGTVIHRVPTAPSLRLPQNKPTFVLNRFGGSGWGTGRAGMRYRDLIPDRQGGRFIASHISIPDGGPVPDYVHHHHIRFQMIFCHTGWATLVYEDQGEPFRFEAGDCVLQPPHIRHRVIETSDHFEVVEIGCPAVHDTLRDHDLELPTDTVAPDRDFGGQRFVRHRNDQTEWTRWRFDGFDYKNFGIDRATDGLAEVGLVRTTETGTGVDEHVHHDEFLLWFVRHGSATLHHNGTGHRLEQRDSVVLAAGDAHQLSNPTGDFQFLEVRLP